MPTTGRGLSIISNAYRRECSIPSILTIASGTNVLWFSFHFSFNQEVQAKCPNKQTVSACHQWLIQKIEKINHNSKDLGKSKTHQCM